MNRPAPSVIWIAAAVTAFAAIHALYERRVLAPMLGADLAAALGLAAVLGAIVTGALLAFGWRRI